MTKEEFTITVYTENQVGLLNRIAMIFTRRKLNIESLNTSPSEIESVFRFTIVITETFDVIQKVFSNYCDDDGLMTKQDIIRIPIIADLLV